MQFGASITLCGLLILLWLIVSYLKKTYEKDELDKISQKIIELDFLKSKNELFEKIHAYFLFLSDQLYRPWNKIIKNEKNFILKMQKILGHGSNLKKFFRIVFHGFMIFEMFVASLFLIKPLIFDTIVGINSLLYIIVYLSSFYFRFKYGFSYFRSAIITLSLTFLGTVLFSVYGLNDYLNAVVIPTGSNNDFVAIWSKMFFLSSAFNIPADYISIIESRWILSKINTKKMNNMIGFLLLDILLTAVIFIIISFHVYLPEYKIGLNQVGEKMSQNWFGQEPVLIGNVYALFLVPFISTFFTSIILYLFVLTSFIVRGLLNISKIAFFAQYIFNPKKYPLDFLGLALTISLVILFVCIKIFSVLIKFII
jgi:hypothetical protein